MFFSDERFHFFRPLTSKYREQAVQCLGLLYQRQYSSSADYGQSLSRDQLIEIFEEALTHSANQVLDNNEDDEQEQRFKNTREQSTWMLKQFLESGWIERQVDSATLQSTFPFTRMGRVFSQALIESNNAQIRTRHRNTRNTLNALEAFLSRGEIYDLLDAYEYSERIITDFTDVISELEERKRELVREVESQQLVHQATDQFFDFMEKRFQPDISVRLSADSVEKHRADIDRAIGKIRRKQKEFKRDVEQELRRTVPGICSDEKSYLWHILDTIEQRMRNAAEVMLPALRNALHSFTKRADIIIRQLSYLSSQADSDLLEVCKELADLSNDDYASRLQKAASEMAVLKLQLIDPKQMRLQERRQRENVDSSISEQHAVDEVAQKELMAQQLLDQAFVINNEKVRDYVVNALKGGQSISTKNLPITNAKDLLALAHIIEVGAVNNMSSDFIFKVESTGSTINDDGFYHSRDEFTIELIKKPSSQSRANTHADIEPQSATKTH